MERRKNSLARVVWTLVLGAGLFPLPLRAAPDAELASLRRQAEQCEHEGSWEKACDLYEQVFARDHFPALREHYWACLRHAHQVQRHRDLGYRQQLLSRDAATALKVYGEVLAKVRGHYVDKEKVNFANLFLKGLEEFNFGLEEESFRQTYFPDVSLEAVRTFQRQMVETWGRSDVPTKKEAQHQVFELALAAQRTLGLKPVVTILEFACGACNGLDENSYFLTPWQLTEVCASLAGEVGDIGLDLEARGKKLFIAQVGPGTPASQAGLKRGDQVLRIDEKSAGQFTADTAVETLRGEPDTPVELEVLPAGEAKARRMRLSRQAVAVPSVVQVQIVNGQPGIGYCQIVGFQKSTLQELDEALAQLKMQGMKGLILDLRGNPGGLFPVAVDLVERFLPDGIIVSTQSSVKEQTKVYRANNPRALGIPLVVLIDGETASAAEVVAGALKDNQRATLVGQPTYGKGTLQEVIQLDSVRSGVRLTQARLFSPRGQSFAGGVVPHIPVERLAMTMGDRPLEVAVAELSRLVVMR